MMLDHKKIQEANKLQEVLEKIKLINPFEAHEIKLKITDIIALKLTREVNEDFDKEVNNLIFRIEQFVLKNEFDLIRDEVDKTSNTLKELNKNFRQLFNNEIANNTVYNKITFNNEEVMKEFKDGMIRYLIFNEPFLILNLMSDNVYIRALKQKAKLAIGFKDLIREVNSKMIFLHKNILMTVLGKEVFDTFLDPSLIMGVDSIFKTKKSMLIYDIYHSSFNDSLKDNTLDIYKFTNTVEEKLTTLKNNLTFINNIDLNSYRMYEYFMINHKDTNHEENENVIIKFLDAKKSKMTKWEKIDFKSKYESFLHKTIMHTLKEIKLKKFKIFDLKVQLEKLDTSEIYRMFHTKIFLKIFESKSIKDFEKIKFSYETLMINDVNRHIEKLLMEIL